MGSAPPTFPHLICRRDRPAEYPPRQDVPDHRVAWEIPWPDYDPPYYVSPRVLEQDRRLLPGGWADPEDRSLAGPPLSSFEGQVSFDALGRPMNIRGRTGIAGRGLWGRWGVNRAADPVVMVPSRAPLGYDLLVIQRGDNGQWALPGGMVDGEETAGGAMARELQEETGLILDGRSARVVFQGYADDRRNTDHAWAEATAGLWVMSQGWAAAQKPRAGDDAVATKWLPLDDPGIASLYGSHPQVVRAAIAMAEDGS